MGIFFQFFDDFFFSESGISIINDFSESTGEENGNKSKQGRPPRKSEKGAVSCG